MRESYSGTVSLECPTTTVGLSLTLYLIAGIVAVKPDDIFDLLVVANRYSMCVLVSTIEYTLVRQLNMDNICTLLVYAWEYSMNVLRECCICMALKHYDEFMLLVNSDSGNNSGNNSGDSDINSDSDNGGDMDTEIDTGLEDTTNTTNTTNNTTTNNNNTTTNNNNTTTNNNNNGIPIELLELIETKRCDVTLLFNNTIPQ